MVNSLQPNYVTGFFGLRVFGCCLWLARIRGVCFRSPQMARGRISGTVLRTFCMTIACGRMATFPLVDDPHGAAT